MKKVCLVFIFMALVFIVSAQTYQQYSFKGQGIYGNILKHTKHLKALVQGPAIGGEMAVEWQTVGEKPWQQFLNFPVVGIGAVWLNLSNPDKLGNALAIYPYINFPLWRTHYFNLYLKAGMGASYLTKTYYNTNTDAMGNLLPLDSANAAIGSHLNIYFSGGGSLEFPLNNGLSAVAEYTWNHASNGSAVAPNSGINFLNAFVGLKYCPNYKSIDEFKKKKYHDIPRILTYEIVAASGFRQLYYADNKTYPTASLAFGVYRPFTNFYRMGLGVDAFYDGVYDGQNSQAWQRTYITSDEFKNKLRLGVSWQHELLIGRMSAGFHFGLYLYNPLKNLEPYTDAKNGTLNKWLIYPYNIEKEDGWLYTRAALKYAVSDHYFISLGLKTHLQKAEFIEWGLGYQL